MVSNQEIVTEKSPSNIALIKYWGKHHDQIPANPSISFTLNKCYSETEMSYQARKNKGEKFSVRLLFSGKEQSEFLPKILNFFERILPYSPYLLDFDFTIETKNTFPHSSGISSSASSMSALALCLIRLEQKSGYLSEQQDPLQRASFLARLGSGSACRSIYPGLALWGIHESIKGSSDLYAIPYPYEVHKTFTDYRDTILLIDTGVKKVSSSEGHALMYQHPYAKQRFESARKNFERFISILKEGNLEAFGEMIEYEALSLHSMMMCSQPYFLLMKPDTLHVIEKVRNFREQTGKPLYFTLDAGANVHLLYTAEEKEVIRSFIQKELLKHCQQGQYIEDSCAYF
ncbi:MAG: diphosphomevalonate/mevalonate 3,5-bisphosphate decarboxylase family protein [Flavobacteriales bacterium Tduv]